MGGSEGLGVGWDKVELGLTWFSGLVGVGKGFLKVFENWDQESEIRIFDSNLLKSEKKFRKSAKCAKCFSKCAKCAFPSLRKMQFRNSVFADFTKMPKSRKIGVGSQK